MIVYIYAHHVVMDGVQDLQDVTPNPAERSRDVSLGSGPPAVNIACLLTKRAE